MSVHCCNLQRLQDGAGRQDSSLAGRTLVILPQQDRSGIGLLSWLLPHCFRNHATSDHSGRFGDSNPMVMNERLDFLKKQIHHCLGLGWTLGVPGWWNIAPTEYLVPSQELWVDKVSWQHEERVASKPRACVWSWVGVGRP